VNFNSGYHMDPSTSTERMRVKSWPGLAIGLVGVVSSVGTWIQNGPATYLLSAVGFVCLTIVWSKIPFSFTTPLRETFASAPALGRADAALVWTGLLLIGVSMALRWLL
jgi:hypothetical protein